MLGRVWSYIAAAVDGLKTLGVAALFVLLGLADWYDVVPIQPLLTWLLGDNLAPKVMVILPVIFGTLRFVSSGSVKWTKAWREEKAEGESTEVNKGAN